jgi:hypothetical protein
LLSDSRGGFTARELLELVAHEVTVAALLVSDAVFTRISVAGAPQL